MFELLLTMCLPDAPGVCRDVLVPEGPFATLSACEAAAAERAGETSTCGPAGEALDFEEVADGLFVHRGRIEEPDEANRGDVANIAFVVGAESVLVVDAGSARWIAEATWRAIRARTDLPIGHLVLSHVHPDHVLGAELFVAAGAEVVGHANLNRALSDRVANYVESFTALIGAQAFLGTEPVGASTAVDDTAEIDLGGRIVELRAWPAAHTATDLTVFDRETGTLIAGDLVFAEHTPALDGSLTGWQAVLGEMKAIPATGVVPGHGGPLLPWPEGAAPLERYLETLARDTRAAIAEGARIGEAAGTVAASEAGSWALFEAYNPRNATEAFTELEWE